MILDDPLSVTSSSFLYSLEEGDEHPLVTVKDHRSPLQRTRALLRACLRQTIDLFALARHYAHFFAERRHLFITPERTESGWRYDEMRLPWTDTTESDGLYLFIHGLRGHPLNWGGYLRELQEKSPRAHFFVPHIIERGNCPLEWAAEPLLHAVRHYLRKFPKKPVTLIGASNGGRILSYLECHLNVEEMRERRLSSVSIAGVHYGTLMIDWLDTWHLLPLALLHRRLIDELRWENPYAKELLERWSRKQAEWNRHGIDVHHLFCATLEDEKVISRSSSLPILPDGNCHYQIYSGENHQTLLSAAQKEILHWLTKV
jgi:hypothetical protein